MSDEPTALCDAPAVEGPSLAGFLQQFLPLILWAIAWFALGIATAAAVDAIR